MSPKTEPRGTPSFLGYNDELLLLKMTSCFLLNRYILIIFNNTLLISIYLSLLIRILFSMLSKAFFKSKLSVTSYIKALTASMVDILLRTLNCLLLLFIIIFFNK